MRNHRGHGLIKRAGLFITLVSFYLSLPLSAKAPDDTIYIDKGKIYSAAGEVIVMRGFNEMFVWSNDRTGKRWLPEMAKTGANSVRLVWDHSDKKPQHLVALIERSIKHNMIAIPECHNATGKWGKELDQCVQFWNNPLLIKAIQKNRRWTILNIANEAGDHSITDKDFIATYSSAINSLRNWGYTVPIMIDASMWGQNLDQILAVGAQLQAQDPLNKIIYSVHSYWPAAQARENYMKVALAAQRQGIAIIIGEGPSVTRVGQCADPTPLPYVEGMEILHKHNIGWLNWSWGGMKNGDCDEFRYFDITHDGRFGTWQHEPGATIVAHSPYSVMQTSRRPASFYRNGKITASGIYTRVEKTIIMVGESTALHVLVAPMNASNPDYVITISGDKQAIKLDQHNHVITGLTTGSARITATTKDGKISWSTKIYVK